MKAMAMTIEWIGGFREVRGVGLLNTGDTREVPEDIGRALIRQGRAVKVKPIKQKQTQAGD